METITLRPLVHRGAEVIGIYSAQKSLLNYIFQQAGAKWSQTNKCWWIPLTKVNYNKLIFAVNGIAQFEIGELKQYLHQRKGGPNHFRISIPVIPAKKMLPVSKAALPAPAVLVSDANKQQLQKFLQQLQLKAYSPSTIRTYRNEFMQ